MKKLLEAFTTGIVGVSLLPSLKSGVGGAAGSIADLAQPFAAIGVAGKVKQKFL